jgi:hypothetical protein
MPNGKTLPHPMCSLGDTATVVELALLLLLDVIAIEAPDLTAKLIAEFDKLLKRKMGTPGAQQQLTLLRNHLQMVIANGTQR